MKVRRSKKGLLGWQVPRQGSGRIRCVRRDKERTKGKKMAIQQEFARLAPNNRWEQVRPPPRRMDDEEAKVEKNPVVRAGSWGPERRKKSQRTDDKELVAKTGVRTGESLSTRDGRRRCLPQFEELWLEARICPLRHVTISLAMTVRKLQVTWFTTKIPRTEKKNSRRTVATTGRYKFGKVHCAM